MHNMPSGIGSLTPWAEKAKTQKVPVRWQVWWRWHKSHKCQLGDSSICLVWELCFCVMFLFFFFCVGVLLCLVSFPHTLLMSLMRKCIHRGVLTKRSHVTSWEWNQALPSDELHLYQTLDRGVKTWLFLRKSVASPDFLKSCIFHIHFMEHLIWNLPGVFRVFFSPVLLCHCSFVIVKVLL